MLHKCHTQLLEKLELENSKNPIISKLPQGYSGSKSSTKIYFLSNPQIKNIAKDFYTSNKNLEFNGFITLLDSLYSKGKSTTEKYLASYLIGCYKNYLGKIKTNKINEWLGYLTGWAEVDSLCQTLFTAEVVLNGWESWKKLLNELNKDKNISKRGASLVLLTKPARQAKSIDLQKMAFKNIQNLQSEKDILITKAVSWLLREMVKNYKKEVQEFLNENKDSLPKIAVRETTRKINTGRK
ncbi:DNA alkylation repair protein [bacterium]|nr:DNA alkylation repair protein [bacterium]